jgi:hypothetical protein
MHYLNASPNPITVAPHYQWYTIAEADLQQQLAPFVWSYQKFHIPPHSQYTVKADCTFPRPMHLIEAMPHMHALGRRFTIGLTGGPLDGSLVLDSDTYGARGETDIRL